MIYVKLFLSFLQVGLFSVGGGYAAMPLIQNQVVELNPWLTMQEFTDLITIAEMTPGPIAINSATFVGIRIAGILGAVVATLGCIFPSLILVSLLAYVYYRYKSLSALQSVLASLRPAVVALIASAGLSILVMAFFPAGEIVFSADAVDILAVVIFAAAFAVLRIWKPNPIWVMCGAGAAGLILYSIF